MTTNTDPVRALIAKWRRQAAEHGTRTFTGNDHAMFANELESALASAPPSAPVVDEAAATLAFEEHINGSADDPYFEGELELWLAAWRAALAQQSAAPSGEAVGDWVKVPRTPTLAMANAAWRELESQGIDPEDVEAPQVWDAMLAAAPQQPAAVDGAMVGSSTR